MAQAEANLELVIEVESVLSHRTVPLTSPHVTTHVDDTTLDEDEVIETLNLDFQGAPPITLSGFLCLFDAFRESFQVEDAEGPSTRTTHVASGSPIALTILGRIILKMHCIPILSPMGSLGIDVSGSRVSIPSPPFSVSLTGGGEPSQTFPVDHPLIESPRALPNQEDIVVPPSHQSSSAQVNATTPFPPNSPTSLMASSLLA